MYLDRFPPGDGWFTSNARFLLSSGIICSMRNYLRFSPLRYHLRHLVPVLSESSSPYHARRSLPTRTVTIRKSKACPLSSTVPCRRHPRRRTTTTAPRQNHDTARLHARPLTATSALPEGRTTPTRQRRPYATIASSLLNSFTRASQQDAQRRDNTVQYSSGDSRLSWSGVHRGGSRCIGGGGGCDPHTHYLSKAWHGLGHRGRFSVGGTAHWLTMYIRHCNTIRTSV